MPENQPTPGNDPAVQHLQDTATARGMLKYLADDIGLQVLYLNSTSASAIAEAHAAAMRNPLCTPEDRHRHSRMAVLYRRAAREYEILGQ